MTLKEVEKMNLETAIKILKSFRVPEMEAYATVFGEKLGYVSDSVILDKAIKVILKELEKQSFYLETSEMEHKCDMQMIDDLKGKIVSLYNKNDELKNKLKEEMKEVKEHIKKYEKKYDYAKKENNEFYQVSHKRTLNRLQARFETLREILNFIEGESNR